MFSFTITKKSRRNLARTGLIETSHGKVKTPAFMPCATKGSVKGVSAAELADLHFDLILSNTYHLNLRPGDRRIKDFGGLHQFINWPRAILTDSGGYQVFSLGAGFKSAAPGQGRLVKITPEGVNFNSHLDGQIITLTPEKVIDIQRNFGSDIMMVLDVCTEYPVSRRQAEDSLALTHLWAKRSIEHWQKYKNKRQALFGIIQGSVYKDLRLESLKFISSLDFDGVAVGGVSVGEGKANMAKVMKWTGPNLPAEKPHYLMGIGEPEDIIQAVENGFDLFDSVLPTRLGRHGTVWVTADWRKFKKLNLANTQFARDKKVIMANCSCPACHGGYSRAYLRHLFQEKEMLGLRLASLHNLSILQQLIQKIRESI